MKYLKAMGALCILFTLLPSCSPDDLGDTASKNSSIELRSSCQETKTDRLLVNENYSIIVTQCYDENGTLTEIDYTISQSIATDKYAVLDLSNGSSGGSQMRADVLNDKIDNLNYTGSVYASYATDKEEHACECNDQGNSKDDCIVRGYANLVYCDGSFCLACSLVVILESGSQRIQTNSSVVLLPNNF